MKAYLLAIPPDNQFYLAFGDDCEQAAESLALTLGVYSDKFSVAGSWEVGPQNHLKLNRSWPYLDSLKSSL